MESAILLGRLYSTGRLEVKLTRPGIDADDEYGYPCGSVATATQSRAGYR